MSEPPSEKKRPGRKRQYESKGYQDGAPRLATRIAPDVLDWVQTRPEGVRPYLERVVREDRQRTEGEQSMDLTGQQEQAAEA